MMNISLKRKFAIISATIASLLSIVSSASAASNPTSLIAQGCTCQGKPVPERLCPLIHCPDATVPSNDTNRTTTSNVSNDKLAESRVGNGRTIDRVQPSRKISGHLVGNGLWSDPRKPLATEKLNWFDQ